MLLFLSTIDMHLAMHVLNVNVYVMQCNMYVDISVSANCTVCVCTYVYSMHVRLCNSTALKECVKLFSIRASRWLAKNTRGAAATAAAAES